MAYSRFDRHFAHSTPHFLESQGVDIVYQPVTGAAKTISAVIDNPEDLHIREGNPDLQFNRKTIQISSRNNTEGHTDVMVRGDADDGGGDRVIFDDDSVVWFVTDIISKDAGFTVLVVSAEKEFHVLLNDDGVPITNDDGVLINI